MTYKVKKNNGHIVTTHVNRLKGYKSKPSELDKIIEIPQLEQLDQSEQTNKVRDERVGIELEK